MNLTQIQSVLADINLQDVLFVATADTPNSVRLSMKFVAPGTQCVARSAKLLPVSTANDVVSQAYRLAEKTMLEELKGAFSYKDRSV